MDESLKLEQGVPEDRVISVSVVLNAMPHT